MHIKTLKQLELLGFLEPVWVSKIICGEELRAALSAVSALSEVPSPATKGQAEGACLAFYCLFDICTILSLGCLGVFPSFPWIAALLLWRSMESPVQEGLGLLVQGRGILSLCPPS